MNTRFKKLFEPGQIGSLTLKNRLVMGAMYSTLASKDGEATDRLRSYLAERARGGAAMIMVEGTCPHPSGRGLFWNQLCADDDRLIPGLATLAETIHSQGAKAGLQLMHGGRGSLAPPKDMNVQTIAPSAIAANMPSLRDKPPRELSVREIEDLVEAFGNAAQRAKKAGFDAVEICGGTGYLVSTFLSPYSNKRTDQYGGSLENRARFLLEIITSIKEKTGKDFPLSIRMCADERLEQGNTPEELLSIGRMAEKAGTDCLGLMIGWHESVVPSITMDIPVGHWLYLAREWKKTIQVPLMMAYQLHTPEAGEAALAEGALDFVCMSRPFLADPELPMKAQEGRVEDIRPCIACCECLDRFRPPKYEHISCTMNAAMGKEKEYEIVRTSNPKKVMIIGGGPAGLEAARVATLMGHRVALYEKADRLGGQSLLAAVPPNRQNMGKVIQYLSGQIEKLGVQIRMGQEVSPSLIKEENPDAVVVATGATPIGPEILGRKNDRAVTAHDILAGKAVAGKRVVVVGGGLVGVETADYLATNGHTVTIVEQLRRIAMDATGFDRVSYLHRLAEQRVKVLTNTRAERISDQGLLIAQEGVEQMLEADTIVIAVGSRSNRTLLDELGGVIPQIYAAGDCVKPRRLLEAIHDGYAAAFRI